MAILIKCDMCGTTSEDSSSSFNDNYKIIVKSPTTLKDIVIVSNFYCEFEEDSEALSAISVLCDEFDIDPEGSGIENYTDSQIEAYNHVSDLVNSLKNTSSPHLCSRCKFEMLKLIHSYGSLGEPKHIKDIKIGE